MMNGQVAIRHKNWPFVFLAIRLPGPALTSGGFKSEEIGEQDISLLKNGNMESLVYNFVQQYLVYLRYERKSYYFIFMTIRQHKFISEISAIGPLPLKYFFTEGLNLFKVIIIFTCREQA